MDEIYVLIGVLAWIAMHLAATKDRYDDQNKKFYLKKYAQKSWDNWLFSLIGGYVVYFAFPFLWAAYFHYKEKEVPELVEFYAPICGFLGGFILQKIWNIIKKFINGNKTV